MTENEAIYCLKAESERYSVICNECSLYGEVGCDHCYEDATCIAIQALEEIQQYRAIGTVEEIQQKLKYMKLAMDTDRYLLNRYLLIGTIEEFKALKEKNTPKKSIDRVACKDGIITVGDVETCPNCGFIEKLIGRLEESQERYDDVAFAEMNENGQTLDFEYAHGKKDGVEESISIVNQLAEEHNNCWIPCGERLPEEGVEVLVYYKDKDEEYKDNDGIDISKYGEIYFGGRPMGYKNWSAPFEYFHSNYEVIAWMPLPEPYQSKRTGSIKLGMDGKRV